MEEHDEGNLPGRRAVDWTSGVIAGMAAASGDPILALLGPLAVPALQAAFSLDEKAWRKRAWRSARTLQVAASELNVSIEELSAQIEENDSRTELLARVLEASAKTLSLSEKIDALGRVLASSMNDDAAIDEAAMLATSLMEMETMHARVLAEIASYGRVGVSGEELLSKFSGLAIGLSGIANVLTKNGLALERLCVFQIKTPRSEPPYVPRKIASLNLYSEEGSPEPNSQKTQNSQRTLRVWIATPLGLRCLELLKFPRSVKSRPERSFLRYIYELGGSHPEIV